MEPSREPRTFDDEFRIARALAMEAYVKVESAMADLLAVLLGTTERKASHVLFRVTNTSARNAILTSLLNESQGDKYDIFWNGQAGGPNQKKLPGLIAVISQLDTTRNSIAHWLPIQTAGVGDTGYKSWEELRPAHYWARDVVFEPITTEGLNEFIRKANYVSSSLAVLYLIIHKPHLMSAAELETWTHRFEQPGFYPP